MTKNKSLNFLLQTLGCLISAAGIYSFAVAAGIPVTGVAGISAILYRLFGVPMGLSNVLINIPIILCTYKLLGRAFFLRSVYCMILFAISTDYVLPLLPVYQGDRLLATICAGVVGGTVINKMMFGFTSSMLAMIITDDGAAACAEIDRVADRGSTILQGRGGYGGHPRDVVLCACSNKQLYEIEHAMQALDPGCFIIMLQSNEVHGEGFRQLELGKNENRNE